MPDQRQFFYAWIDSSESTFGPEHHRVDELIFSFKFSHEEGQFAQLELEIANPHIGFFAPGRPFWAWFAVDDGTTVTPLFRGRVVGIPSDLFADIITITLVAKPKDYTEQILDLSVTLKTLPFYDPIFIDQTQQDNLDSVLEGYSKLWHVDPVTHVVTVSDVIAGEDGVEEFTQNDAFYDSVKMQLSGSPLLVCEIDATVAWTQCDDSGIIQVQTAGYIYGESNLGNGYNVTSPLSTSPPISAVSTGGIQQTTYSWSHKNTSQDPQDGDIISSSGSTTVPFVMGKLTSQSISFTHANPDTGQGEEFSINQSFQADVKGSPATTATTPSSNLQIGTNLEQNRTELLHVRVVADVQPVLSEATEADSIKDKISMNSSDLVAAGAASSGDGLYFPTQRGLQSLEYILMVARAHLLTKSRVISTSWSSTFDKVVGLSCRKNATIEDARLPGGIVLGKIVLYELTGNGDTGEFIGNVTINSSVGYGNSIVLADGTPDYVNDGYVDRGYQHYTGMFVATTTQDMTFSPMAHVSEGIQLPISNDQVLLRHEYHDTGVAGAMQDLVNSAAPALRSMSFPQIESAVTAPPQELLSYADNMSGLQQTMNQTILDHPTWVEIELAPIQNISTTVEYDADVAPLMIPMQIDLASPSTP